METMFNMARGYWMAETDRFNDFIKRFDLEKLDDAIRNEINRALFEIETVESDIKMVDKGSNIHTKEYVLAHIFMHIDYMHIIIDGFKK